MVRVLHIKDLKDLSFSVEDAIDMQDLKDLKRCFHVNDRGGLSPALRTHLANLENLVNPAHLL